VQEEELLFMHLLDTQMATIMLPLAFSKHALSGLGHDRTTAVAGVRFLKRCFQRQSLQTKCKQVVARMNYSIVRSDAIRTVFPGARFVFVYRHPVQAIASHLSLHRSIFDRQWGAGNIPASAWDRYVKRRYVWSCSIYKRMAAELATGNGNVLALDFDDITQNLAHTVTRITEFAGIRSSEAFREVVEAKGAQQGAYKAGHSNLPLSAFGFSEELVCEDLKNEIEAITNTLRTRCSNEAGK
jgi:hypothetical protein